MSIQPNLTVVTSVGLNLNHIRDSPPIRQNIHLFDLWNKVGL